MEGQIEGLCEISDRFVETLEDRIAPAIFASISGDTLLISGNSSDGDLLINADPNDSSRIIISSTSDTFNRTDAVSLSFSGVKNISVQLGKNFGEFYLGENGQLALEGSFSLKGSPKNAEIAITNLDIGGILDIALTSRSKDSEADIYFRNTNVEGDVNISVSSPSNRISFSNWDGDWTHIGGDFTVKAKTGYTNVQASQMDFGGNVDVFYSAKKDEMGSLSIQRSDPMDRAPIIGGDITVKNRGNGHTNIYFDATFSGDAELDSGSGSLRFQILPPLDLDPFAIGDLTIKGKTVEFAAQEVFSSIEDLDVRAKALNFVISGAEVSGTTKVSAQSGSGGIYSSVFLGRFDFSIGNVTASTAVSDASFHSDATFKVGGDFGISGSIFHEAVSIRMSPGDDTITFLSSEKSGPTIVEKGGLVVDMGKGNDAIYAGTVNSSSLAPALIVNGDLIAKNVQALPFDKSQISFLNGGSLIWLS